MTSARDAFLQRVRDAVKQGNRVGRTPTLPQRGQVGYQGSGTDPLARLQQELTAAGGVLHLVDDAKQARSTIVQLVENKGAKRILLGEGELFESLNLFDALSHSGVMVHRIGDLTPETQHERFFQADIGISGVDHVIAETGTLALTTRADQPRSLTLLPPIHIAVARKDQLLADLFDLFEGPKAITPPPACLTLITGPSKTGDIELKLVTGVHGPGEVHLVVF